MERIQGDTVFRKTAKGIEEIDKRTLKLGMKQRAALIMVDGERSAETIVSRLPGNGEELLAEIYRGGFVEVVSGDAPAPRAEVAAAPGAAPVAFDLKSTQRAAVHAVEELFGPEGESIALKIERASTPSDLMAILERTRDLIRGTRGEARAAKFWDGIFK